MTREEEIEREANRTSYNTDELHSFIKGAEWADENPKKGLVNIDKVCGWLDNIDTDNYMDCETLVFQMTDLIIDLRKAMNG